jgi:hypothetical protein
MTFRRAGGRRIIEAIMIRNVAGALLLAQTLVAPLFFAAPAALAEGKFDGPWSVVVHTSTGPCDPSARFSGQIVNSEISYAYGSLEVTGHVEASGLTHVHVTYGDAHGEAHGHLGAAQGSGTWSGDGPNGRCTGTWSATRK